MSGKAKPQQEESGGEGAPLWIISFADMMSLLMAFFVMLSTFSSFGPNEAAKLSKVAHATIAPNFGWHKQVYRRIIGYKPKGSQLSGPNSTDQPPEKIAAEGLYATVVPKDIRDYKIFLVESKKIFWSNGTTLSTNGRNFLNALVPLVKKQSGRILISERGKSHNNNDLGMSRALSVLDYLVSKDISKESCNIGAKGMLPDDNFESERMLEITLLDKNIYK